ncbi:MAG: hypothetical protein EPO28_16225 [Saprospiraceae bacterium]|nr:MAG: hypothetical protein EPO28_16225 [Saprospiraceae bacterium]
MKKLHLAIAGFALLFATTVFGQTGKGSVLLGGTAGFTKQFESAGDLFSITLSPTFGYFVADKIVLGGQLGFGYSKSGDFSVSSFSLTPFARYYFGPEGTLKFFIQGEGGFLTSKFKGGFSDESLSGAIFGGGPGIAIFLNDHVAIEGILKYSKSTGDFDTSDLALLFGIQAYLGGK